MSSFVVEGGNYTDQNGTITWDASSIQEFAGNKTFGGVEVNVNSGLVAINSIDALIAHNVKTIINASSSLVEINVQNAGGLQLFGLYANTYDLLQWTMKLKSKSGSNTRFQIQAWQAIGDARVVQNAVGANTTALDLASIDRGLSSGAQLYSMVWGWVAS